MPVFIHLFHGREDPNQDMDDWGSDGPEIGPLEYVHTTYGTDIKFSCAPSTLREFFPSEADELDHRIPHWRHWRLVDHNFHMQDDMIKYNDIYYGDWSVYSK